MLRAHTTSVVFTIESPIRATTPPCRVENVQPVASNGVAGHGRTEKRWTGAGVAARRVGSAPVVFTNAVEVNITGVNAERAVQRGARREPLLWDGK